jgi:hypothetical protein
MAVDGDLAAPATAGEDERALLARLAQLVSDGTVTLAIDRRKLGHIDFPLGQEADGNRWVYALVAVTALVFWQLGIPAGLVAIVLSTLVYYTLGLRDVARRLDRRIRDKGLASADTWRKLWRFGGVILTGPDGRTWQGPEQSWMRLVRETAEP